MAFSRTMTSQRSVATLQVLHTKHRADAINRKWSLKLKINEDKQLQGEMRALEIGRGTTIKITFSGPTAQSHIMYEPVLALHLDAHKNNVAVSQK